MRALPLAFAIVVASPSACAAAASTTATTAVFATDCYVIGDDNSAPITRVPLTKDQCQAIRALWTDNGQWPAMLPPPPCRLEAKPN